MYFFNLLKFIDLLKKTNFANILLNNGEWLVVIQINDKVENMSTTPSLIKLFANELRVSNQPNFSFPD